MACHCGWGAGIGSSARAGYSVMYTLAMTAAWVMRNYAGALVAKLPGILKYLPMQGGNGWYGLQAVYRISFGNFAFFAFMAALLYNTRYKNGWRDLYVQHGIWGLKGLLWLAFNISSFFLPGELKWYGFMSRFGSGIFLVLQMIIVLDVTHYLNDTWFRKGKANVNYLYLLLATTIGAYLGAVALSIAGFLFFKPQGHGYCSFNVAVLIWSLLLVVGLSFFSVHPAAREGSLFPASVVSFYCMYLCFTALQSEPRDYHCNGVGHSVAVSDSTVFMGVFITLLAVVYAAWRAGSKAEAFFVSRKGDVTDASTPLLEEVEEGISAGPECNAPDKQEMPVKDGKGFVEPETVTYNYTFFHIVFALASMYMAMLITGWGATSETIPMDMNWISVWVSLGSQFATALLYVWSLMAPTVAPSRNFC